MVKYLMTLLLATLFLPVLVSKAQQPYTYQLVDSITWQCHLKGDWAKLLLTGKQAIGQNIDYKRLRQRMGYAYFARSDFYAAQSQYEKALTFDEYDPVTKEYLYYCALNTGNPDYARMIARELPAELKRKLNIKAFIPIDAIDVEYNYKANDSQTRSNPTYLRAGLSALLGYRVKLYQSVSNYQQIIDSELTKQPEYFALITWSITTKISFDAAYHYLNTMVAGNRIPGNLVFASLSAKFRSFNIGAGGSMLSSNIGSTDQLMLRAGITMPGIYFNSSVNEMVEAGKTRTIFSETAGKRLTNKLWAEGKITLGNLKNYNDYKALYVYNSVDPTTFRAGATLFWYLGKKLTLFGNYTFDKKEISSTLNKYNQQSFSGGIIWKL